MSLPRSPPLPLRTLPGSPPQQAPTQESRPSRKTPQRNVTLLPTPFGTQQLCKRRIREAQITRFVLHNPQCTASQISSALGLHEPAVLKLLDRLVDQCILTCFDADGLYSVSYDNFELVVDLIRKLVGLEEHLAKFNV